jgi:hypothetical protein
MKNGQIHVFMLCLDRILGALSVLSSPYLATGGLKVGSEPAYYNTSMGSNPGISQKYKIGDISTGVAQTL